MKMLKVLIVSCMLALPGCATFAPPTPDTPVEAVAVTAATIEGLANSVVTQLEAGRITVEQARRMQDSLEKAYAGVKLAEEALAAGDVSTAEGQLALVEALLAALERELSNG